MKVKYAKAEGALSQIKGKEEQIERMETKVQEISQEKKNAEAAHRETVMDLNGKLNEKDSHLQQAK